MPKHYYKTTQIDAVELAENIKRCKSQDKKVYELFKVFGRMTKWDVYDEYNNMVGKILASSVGRAITTLCDIGLITKTSESVINEMNHSNHIYEINSEPVIATIKRNEDRLTAGLKVNVVYGKLPDGTVTINTEAMFNDLNRKIDNLLNRTGLIEHPKN